MIINLTKPTTHDALESIWWDYHYPITNVLGNIEWKLSQDFQNEESLAYLEAVEHFVDSIAKSSDLPFIFDKNFAGTTVKKPNDLGELFYKLLTQQNKQIANPKEFMPNSEHPNTFKIRYGYSVRHKYQVSENMEILYFLASELKLNYANFTGNPLSKITNDGLLEGELINSLVTRLQETTKRRNFKTKVENRKKESSQSFNKTKRYVERLHANNPFCFYSIRLVICYKSQYAASISLEKSNDHLMKFLDALETDSTLGSPVGWWWKREYMTETSYLYHLIVFFDPQKILHSPEWFKNTYNSYWNIFTQKRGASFSPLLPLRDNQRCGFQLNMDNFDSMYSVLSSTQRMFMRDDFLRLKRDPNFDHFGMGKLPKLANPD